MEPDREALSFLIDYWKCDICGRIGRIGTDFGSPSDGEVMFMTDPYDSEIQDDYNKKWICHMCYETSCDEI